MTSTGSKNDPKMAPPSTPSAKLYTPSKELYTPSTKAIYPQQKAIYPQECIALIFNHLGANLGLLWASRRKSSNKCPKSCPKCSQYAHTMVPNEGTNAKNDPKTIAKWYCLTLALTPFGITRWKTLDLAPLGIACYY